VTVVTCTCGPAAFVQLSERPDGSGVFKCLRCGKVWEWRRLAEHEPHPKP